mgnify:FL=1|tara:strand:+ start:715 stop:1761 length:1047 start_codon:yes stop_codon:yes gene_type:complete
MASNTITEQIVREAPEVEAQKLAMLAAARELVAQPQYLPAVEAVGLSPTETQAIDLAKQGIGAFEPYMQAGAQGITQGMALTQGGANLVGGIETAPQFQQAQDFVSGAAQGYDPRMAQQFMNPYQQQVTQNALGEMRRQADIGRQSQAAQAVGAGAFGSTREGVQRAEYDRGVADLMQQRIMQDYAQNYGQAQQSAQQSFEAQQGRQLAAGQGIGALTGQQASTDLARGQALGQFGGQMGSLGGQYGALGQATQQVGAADVGLLAGLGGLERQVGQSQVDAIRATQLQEQMAPYQQLGFLSDIYRGAPSTQMALTAQSAPSASPLQSAVGLGVGALSTAAGAKTMGLL